MIEKHDSFVVSHFRVFVIESLLSILRSPRGRCPGLGEPEGLRPNTCK